MVSVRERDRGSLRVYSDASLCDSYRAFQVVGQSVTLIETVM